MSYSERRLMERMDKIILNADSKELSELQKIDIKTQLDGNWFYDHYVSLHLKPQQKIQARNKF